ncbi:MAG: hypothetical protein EBS90_07605 [Betaproteobacteria bacterium]|nr:hypothetical protein [Betaproteobacteria bacterium]
MQVDKEPGRWVVKTEQGQQLIGVPFRLVYDQREIADADGGYDDDRLLALEVCLLMQPLTDADRAEIERTYPGLTAKPAWVVVPETRRFWEVVPVRPPPPPPPRSTQILSPPYAESDKRGTPAEVFEPDPERKLLV